MKKLLKFLRGLIIFGWLLSMLFVVDYGFVFAGNFNEVRIENEDKLSVPVEYADEVWEYLESTYIDTAEVLKNINPAFKSSQSEEYFIDIYYDTPYLNLLNEENGIRYRMRFNLSNPDDKKNGRELIQIKTSNIDDNDLSRAEIKFDVKHYKERKNKDDLHPLIGLVKRSGRFEFKERVEDIGINPYHLAPMFTVAQLRKRIYINNGKESFITISFDEVSSKRMFRKVRFFEIEPELNEIIYTAANEETRIEMEKVSTIIFEDLTAKFPYIKRDLRPKYNKVYDMLKEKIWFYDFWIKIGVL